MLSADRQRPPLWARFDADWYSRTYADEIEDAQEDPEAYYRRIGVTRGHSPNPFFDERYYVWAYPDVAQAVAQGFFESGFMHYVESGHPTRNPHWLFSEDHYLATNPDIGRRVLNELGFLNGYDHYLNVGDLEYRSGHLFFDPQIYRDARMAAERPIDYARGCFEQFVRNTPLGTQDIRASLYFDPVWYLENYPDVRQAIGLKQFQGALHHYLMNNEAAKYDPNGRFSEARYAAANPDVAAELHHGRFRNAYDHFIRFGCFDLRSPDDTFDLRGYAHSPVVRDDLATGRSRDAFAHLIAHEARTAPPAEAEPPLDAQYEELARRRANALVPLAVRSPLRFDTSGSATMSVIMVVRNGFGKTLASLTKLRDSTPTPIDLIIVDLASRDETRNIDHFVKGAHILRTQSSLSLAEAFNEGLTLVKTPFCLWIEQGVEPMFGMIESIVAQFDRSRMVGAVAGRVLLPNGMLGEAGAIVRRDGSIVRYGHGGSATMPRACFTRHVDTASVGAVALRTSSVREVGGVSAEFSEFAHICADLSFNLSLLGMRIVFDPDFVLQSAEFFPRIASARGDADARLRLRHATRLRFQPSGGFDSEARRNFGRRTLMLTRTLPHDVTIGNARRLIDIARALSDMGTVTLFSLEATGADLAPLRSRLPASVEIVHDQGFDQLGSFLEIRARFYDQVWICGADLLPQIVALAQAKAPLLPQDGFILDAATVNLPRTAFGPGELPPERFNEALRREFAQSWFCQSIVVATPAENAMLQAAGLGPVHTVSAPLEQPPVILPWAERRDIVFAGVFNNPPSLEMSSFDWFVHHVLPNALEQLPEDARLIITGPRGHYISFARFVANPQVVYLPEPVDLNALYAKARLFIAPVTYTTEFPYECLDASAQGVPVVTSDRMCKFLDRWDGEGFLSGGDGDPGWLAHAIIASYNDEPVWTRLSNAGMAYSREHHGRDAFRASLVSVIEDSRAPRSPAVR